MSLCYGCFQEKNENETVCPYCGYDASFSHNEYPSALPEGTVLGGKYVVGKVLGQGGFGITYIAQDYKTKSLVAVKEYFPDTLAIRRDARTISPFTGERAENFEYGKKCFLEEADTLSKFIGNENICKILSYFEENGTAYFAMEYLDGISLLDRIRLNGGKIGYEEAKQILFPIMDALSAVHEKGIIHRDISPDNIFIEHNGKIKLIDFGAARYSLGDKSRSLDIVIKHGYAPKEQYTRHGKQGPFTDIYSLAATFYKAITGRTPPDSIDRLEEDNIVLPSVLGSDIPGKAEDALMTALSVNPSDRFRSMEDFKKALTEEPADSTAEVVINEKPDPVALETKQETQPETQQKSAKKPILIAGIILIGLAVAVGAVFLALHLNKPSAELPAASEDQTETAMAEETFASTEAEVTEAPTEPPVYDIENQEQANAYLSVISVNATYHLFNCQIRWAPDEESYCFSFDSDVSYLFTPVGNFDLDNVLGKYVDCTAIAKYNETDDSVFLEMQTIDYIY